MAIQSSHSSLDNVQRCRRGTVSNELFSTLLLLSHRRFAEANHPQYSISEKYYSNSFFLQTDSLRDWGCFPDNCTLLKTLCFLYMHIICGFYLLSFTVTLYLDWMLGLLLNEHYQKWKKNINTDTSVRFELVSAITIFRAVTLIAHPDH